jgi:hypothetical protein
VLNLSVPRNYGPLKLVSFIKPTFTMEITFLLPNAFNSSEAKYLIVYMNYNTLPMAAIYVVAPCFSLYFLISVTKYETE